MSEDFSFFNIAGDVEHFYNIQYNTQKLYSLEKRCSYPDYDRSTRFCMDMLNSQA